MNKSNNATSIIEAIVMILILTFGILGAYNIYIKSYALSISTKNKIQAIEIAREGIEAMENIRNTNWILLGADPLNCWNSFNYDMNCVGNTSDSSDSSNTDIKKGSYKIYTNNISKWVLEAPTLSLHPKDYSNSNYRNFFRIRKDSNSLYTQSGGTNFFPLFTREIIISYPEDTNGDGSKDTNDEKMQINSIVMWEDGHGKKAHLIELEGMLTNWK